MRAVVLSELEESDSARRRLGIDHRGLDHRLHFGRRAQSFPTRQAGAHDVRPAGIAEIRGWIGLRHRIEREESRIVEPRDSNLVAYRAADGVQHPGVSRAPLCVVLQRVLLGQIKLAGFVRCMSSTCGHPPFQV